VPQEGEGKRPLMPKATAVWLIDNSSLTWDQISDFTGLHALEVRSIADGEVGQGIDGLDPVESMQLTQKEIARCEADATARLRLLERDVPKPEKKRTRGKFTPLVVRQNRPAAIAWLLRYHPELSTGQIIRLVGSTKNTVEAVRNRTHSSIRTMRPADPVSLGLCRQVDLDEVVQKASRRKSTASGQKALTEEERRSLLSSDSTLAPFKEPTRSVKGFDGLENFTLTQGGSEGAGQPAVNEDPEKFFSIPESKEEGAAAKSEAE